MHGSRRARRHRVAWCNGVDKGSEDSGGWRHLIINPRIIIPRAEGSLAGLCRVRCFVYASGWQPPVLHSLVAFCTAVNRLGSARPLASRLRLNDLKCCQKGPRGFADGCGVARSE